MAAASQAQPESLQPVVHLRRQQCVRRAPSRDGRLQWDQQPSPRKKRSRGALSSQWRQHHDDQSWRDHDPSQLTLPEPGEARRAQGLHWLAPSPQRSSVAQAEAEARLTERGRRKAAGAPLLRPVCAG